MSRWLCGACAVLLGCTGEYPAFRGADASSPEDSGRDAPGSDAGSDPDSGVDPDADVCAPSADRVLAGIAAGGASTCVWTRGGDVWCWGRNDRGQVGDGTTEMRAVPTHVRCLAGVVEVELGAAHACARTSAGRVLCWGANDRGQLGDGTAVDAPAPVEMRRAGEPLDDARDLALGDAFSCVARSAGIACAGANDRGQLGTGASGPDVLQAELVADVVEATGVGAGSAHACALVGMAVRCWGANDRHQLADGSTDDRAAPVAVPGITNAIAIGCGDAHCAIGEMGGIYWGWGDNARGQIGDMGGTADPPRRVLDVLGPAQIAGGAGHTCVRYDDLNMECWGANGEGQVGDGTRVDRFTPVMVASGEVLHVAAGAAHTCIVDGVDGVSCWGANADGQLGDGSPGAPRALPAPAAW